MTYKKLEDKKVYMMEASSLLRYDIPKVNVVYSNDPSFFWDYSFSNKERCDEHTDQTKDIPHFMLVELKDGVFIECLSKLPLVSEIDKADGNGIYFRASRDNNNHLMEIKKIEQYQRIIDDYDAFGAEHLLELVQAFHLRGYICKKALEKKAAGKTR